MGNVYFVSKRPRTFIFFEANLRFFRGQRLKARKESSFAGRLDVQTFVRRYWDSLRCKSGRAPLAWGELLRDPKKMRKLQNLAEKAEISLPTLASVEHQERFNTFSHYIAAAFSFLGCCILLVMAVAKEDMARFLSFAIYGVTTVGLYCISTLYHGSNGVTKDFFRHLDHMGIYLKIAGNYTPYAVLVFQGTSSWIILGTVWGLALIGIVQELFFESKTRRLSVGIYAVMSASFVPLASELYHALPPLGFAIVMVGFISYSIGAFFFFNDHRYKYGHEFWHVGVVGGSLCHYLGLLFYVA